MSRQLAQTELSVGTHHDGHARRARYRKHAMLALAGALVLIVGSNVVTAAESTDPITATPADDAAAYRANGCAACHSSAPHAGPAAFPVELSKRVVELAKSAEGRRYLVAAMAFGVVSPPGAGGQAYGVYMPGNPNLAAEDVARTLNWLNRGGGAAGESIVAFDADAIRAQRLNPMSPEHVYLIGSALRPSAVGGAQTHPLRLATDLRDPDDIQGPSVTPRARYLLDCAGCHGLNGEARVASVPTIRNFMGYFTHNARGRAYLVRIPGSTNSLLSDGDLAAVINWMLESFSRAQLPSGFKPYTEPEVRRLRANPLVLDAQPERDALVAQLRRAGVIPLSLQAERNASSALPSPSRH